MYMTIKSCDSLISDLEGEIEDLKCLIDLFGAGLGYEESLLQKENDLSVLTAISDIKTLKSMVQQLEHLLVFEYRGGPGNGPAVNALINMINVTPKKTSYRTAFNISKSINQSEQKTKKRILTGIKEVARNLRLPSGNKDGYTQ